MPIEIQNKWPKAEALWQQVASPLAQHLMSRITSEKAKPFTFGVTGSQGSGKSTLVEMLEYLCHEAFGLQVARLSLDDFYLSRAERQQRANDIHPLFATRGVPGTHDIEMAIELMQHLQAPQAPASNTAIALPRFNKATDEPFPSDQWPQIILPVDVILIEGWCLKVTPQEEADLGKPINALEANEDAQGIWRRQVNEYLGGAYQALFSMIDECLWLNAQTFDVVYQWRRQQEQALRDQTQQQAHHHVMSDADLKRFIQFFQRLTEYSFRCLPDITQYQVGLASDRRISTKILPL